MSKKPIVGISSSILVDSGGMFPGYKRAYVNYDYVDSIIMNGAVPMIIPFHENREIIKQQIEQVDALILSGGHDVAPKNYNEEPMQALGEIFPERDEYDFALLEFAMERKIPILGICRGAQIINVYHGGNMDQDLSYREGVTYKHSQNHSPDLLTHSIQVKKDSLLYSILEAEETMVNSFHHQTIKDVPDSLHVVANAKDGVVEAIESTTYPFLLGVQWHPEMLHKNNEQMNKLFKRLITEAEGK